MELKKALQQAKATNNIQASANPSNTKTNGKPIDQKKAIFDSDDEKSTNRSPDSKLRDGGSTNLIKNLR